MNLVKWFRKNNKKVMAVVVIIIMLAFTAGPALRYFGRMGGGDPRQTIAYFGDDKKITNYDRALAHQELEILRMVGADELLRNVSVPVFRMWDLRPIVLLDLRAALLGELLFPERRISPQLINHIKQIIRVNGYRISDKQINDIYRRPMGSDIYWLLLKNEAQLAGIRIPNKQAGNLLARAIPQLVGTTYSQLIGSIVNPPPGANRQGIPEQEILATLSKLLAVLQYAKMICSSENVTAAQIMHNASWENETMDVEFVKFDSAVFAEDQNEPAQEQLVEHFDKYKKFFAGAVSEENPYGFGYKLPDRVQLEYIVVKLDEVSEIVTAPTQEEAEEYYQKHTEQFTVSIPSDPNDPNSPPIKRTKSYAEVASIISNQLLRSKINSRAERILQEAKTLTEAGFEDTDTGSANLGAEQLKQMSGDYKIAAEQLSEKYKINVYAGKTGLLSAADIQVDEHLGRLYLRSYANNLLWLAQIAFAIDELATSELGPFDIPKPKMYENIGPMRDILGQMPTRDASGQIVAIVRIIKAQKASEPESINRSFSKTTLSFDKTEKQATGGDVYSVKEKVAEDLKKLAAMNTAKSKVEEFIGLVAKDGWEATIDKFNKLYRQQSSQGDPNVFKLQNQTNLRRISRTRLETLAVQNAGNPMAELIINEHKNRSQYIDQLYSLAPEGKDAVESVPLIIEFKPDMSYYCVKDISVKRLEQEQYEKIKALQAYKENVVQSQSLAAVHFSPENILKRMKFRLVEQKKEPAEVNEAAQSEGLL